LAGLGLTGFGFVWNVDGPVGSVGFLTIEDRERETWAAELARGLGPSERDFGGHVYQETNTSFLEPDFGWV
jgi:hypothetical protein